MTGWKLVSYIACKVLDCRNYLVNDDLDHRSNGIQDKAPTVSLPSSKAIEGVVNLPWNVSAWLMLGSQKYLLSFAVISSMLMVLS
jgi:hypothetical protein